MLDISNLRRLAGKTVTGSDGERIGKVVDVYESTAPDGRGTFATVATGLLGTGQHFFPLDAAELRDGDVVVPYTKDVVKGAPHVQNDDELTADEEHQLFAYYGMADAAASGLSEGTSDGEMTRSEERLSVSTERVETGRVRLRKYVVTETVTQTVPVSYEELRVQREPITTQPLAGTAVRELTEEEHEIVLTAERPVVEKTVVPVERVHLETVTVTDSETVTEQVRKEQIELDGDVPVDASHPTASGERAP